MESFHHYPRNLGGVALLLLRLSVGTLVLWVLHVGNGNGTPTLLFAIALAICIGIGVGILTPVLSGLAVLGGITLLCCVPAYISTVSVVTLLLCVSTAFLGAGAYSLDGMLFGRRRIIL